MEPQVQSIKNFIKFPVYAKFAGGPANLQNIRRRAAVKSNQMSKERITKPCILVFLFQNKRNAASAPSFKVYIQCLFQTAKLCILAMTYKVGFTSILSETHTKTRLVPQCKAFFGLKKYTVEAEKTAFKVWTVTDHSGAMLSCWQGS